jgi:hypothetical protein
MAGIPLGAHAKPGGLTKLITGDAPLRMGEDPLKKYLTNPLSSDAGKARAVQSANKAGIGLQWGAGGVPNFILPGHLPASGGGGGGGGSSFRMRPQDPNKRVGVRVGPRTAAEWREENVGPGGSTLDAAYARGDLTPGAGMMPGVGAPAPAVGGDSFEQTPAFDPVAAGFERPKGGGAAGIAGFMADGGTLGFPVGGPTLVGEEGPELILPREDGRGFVVPADVTAALLPAMTNLPGRADGGTLPPDPEVVRTPGGIFSGFSGPSGSGFATRLPQGTQELVATATPRMMFDPQTGNQMDMDAPGLPVLPDEVTGPWAQGGMQMTPEQQTALTAATTGRAERLMAMPGARTDAQRADGQLVLDAVTGEEVPLSEMRGRVIDRSSMAWQDREDARVRQDLANRAARAPVGTIPGAMDPLQRRMDRNMEKFLRTPQGTMWAAEQQQGMAGQQQQMQAANQWMPLADPTTGRPFALVNGKGQTLSLPSMQEDEQIITVSVQKPDPITGMLATVQEPRIYSRSTGKMRDIPMEEAAAVKDTGEGGGNGVDAAATPKSNAARGAESSKNKARPNSGFLKAVGQ